MVELPLLKISESSTRTSTLTSARVVEFSLKQEVLWYSNPLALLGPGQLPVSSPDANCCVKQIQYSLCGRIIYRSKQ